MRTLNTVSEIIAAVGGPTKFARWSGVTPKLASMWKNREIFPPEWHNDHTTRLKAEFGIKAPPSLWKQKTAGRA